MPRFGTLLSLWTPADNARMSPHWLRSLWFLLMLSLWAGGPAAGQPAPMSNANRPLRAARCPEELPAPVVDGDLSDPAWKFAPKAETFYDPQTGKPAPDQTEASLLYDREYIYVSFYCRDSQPETIVARETVRDADLENDDHVLVEFDPFLTYKREDRCRFIVNARGTQRTRIGGGRADKLEWQGDWQAATRRVSDGWTVEMRIPWGILSYPRTNGPVTMGLNFRRHQVRTQISSMWSDLGPQYFNDRQGLWQGVVAPIQTWKPRLSFLPYMMPSLQASGGRSQFRAGLDARYQPTPELTGVGTINPDFASVEGAVEGIFFSRAERFVPDRRPFFLEGRGDFELGEDYALGMLFNSRRIERVDAGLKVYGKLNSQTTVGALGTVGFGSEANVVTQLRRELGPTSNARLMLQQRLAPGEDNTVLAFASQYRRGFWSTEGQVVQTLGPEAGGLGWTVAANLEIPNVFANLRYRWVPGNYRVRLGYVPFTDFHGFASYTSWSVPWRKGFWRSFELFFYPEWDWHLDGRPFRRMASFGATFETRSDYRLGLDVNGGKFDNQTDLTVGLNLGGGVTNRFRQWGLTFLTGTQADRPITAFGPSFKVRVFRRLDLAFSSYVQNYDGLAQQYILTFNYELSPFRSWGGRTVLENGKLNVYLSYRSSGRGGTDTYIILGDPNARATVSRLMFKWVMAL